MGLLADNAFFHFKQAFCSTIGEHLGIHTARGDTFFAVLFGLVKGIKNCDDATALEIVYTRIQSGFSDENNITKTLLEVDEAANVLDRTDIEELHHEQKEALAEIENHRVFSDEYTRKCAEVRKGLPPPVPVQRPLPSAVSVIEHAVAKSMLPPNSTIWRGHKVMRWCGQYRNHRRISTPWGTTESTAVYAIAKRLWRQHLVHMGLTDDYCTVQGLMSMEV